MYKIIFLTLLGKALDVGGLHGVLCNDLHKLHPRLLIFLERLDDCSAHCVWECNLFWDLKFLNSLKVEGFLDFLIFKYRNLNHRLMNIGE